MRFILGFVVGLAAGFGVAYALDHRGGQLGHLMSRPDE
jgi:hypothetical protein